MVPKKYITSKKLSRKLSSWLNYYLDRGNKTTFLNATAAAEAAGYCAKSKAVFAVIGHENLGKLKDEIDEWFLRGGLSSDHVLQRIKESLDATMVRTFCHEGKIVEGPRRLIGRPGESISNC
jgi:hypothetical protein